MLQDEDIVRQILTNRPELSADTISNWVEGMSGCTLQTSRQVLGDLLYRASHDRPMPWEVTESGPSGDETPVAAEDRLSPLE